MLVGAPQQGCPNCCSEAWGNAPQGARWPSLGACPPPTMGCEHPATWGAMTHPRPGQVAQPNPQMGTHPPWPACHAPLHSASTPQLPFLPAATWDSPAHFGVSQCPPPWAQPGMAVDTRACMHRHWLTRPLPSTRPCFRAAGTGRPEASDCNCRPTALTESTPWGRPDQPLPACPHQPAPGWLLCPKSPGGVPICRHLPHPQAAALRLPAHLFSLQP